MKTCSTPGCPNLIPRGGPSRCPQCAREARRKRGREDYLRGGEDTVAWRRTRARLFATHPFCQCTDTHHGHGPRCFNRSTVADHYPLSRAALLRKGVRNPDKIDHLRALCASCHGKWTLESEGQRGWVGG
jgi:5-methylcytosine-specific restriction protein A